MSMSDPIADMLTRIRNAQMVNKAVVTMPSSNVKTAIASVLKEEGYVEDFAVQTEGCAPLARAWSTAQTDSDVAQHWTEHMWPWEAEPVSVADGILDDETYDWVADTQQLRCTNGRVVVAQEEDVVRAASMGPNLTAIQSSATGTAGLAGLLSERAVTGDSDRVALVLSGISRH